MKLHNVLLKPFGVEIAGTRKMRRYREPVIYQLAELLARRGVRTVLDAGANVGQFARNLRAYGFRGRILSFEPVPECYAELQRASAGDSAWTAHNFALGDADGELEFNLTGLTDMASLKEPSEFGRRTYQTFQDARRIVVPVRRLDRWLEQSAPEVLAAGPLFLKMDTQGYDLVVFRGAEGIHPALAGILAEFAVLHLYQGVPGWMEMLRLFQEAGFEPVEFRTISRDDPSSLMVEFDCLMARPV
jgi:FkbM family methyltransferase